MASLGRLSRQASVITCSPIILAFGILRPKSLQRSTSDSVKPLQRFAADRERHAFSGRRTCVF